MSGLVNVRDYAPAGEVIDFDWAPAFAAAIAEAVTSGRNGVFVPADAAPYTVRPTAPQSIFAGGWDSPYAVRVPVVGFSSSAVGSAGPGT